MRAERICKRYCFTLLFVLIITDQTTSSVLLFCSWLSVFAFVDSLFVTSSFSLFRSGIS